MKRLSKKQKEYFLSIGHPVKDLLQLNRAINISTFKLEVKGENKGFITKDKAIEMLGEETFLSGISRSAFHYTSVRENNFVSIYFDSSKLFK
jgi:hypothetical protein